MIKTSCCSRYGGNQEATNEFKEVYSKHRDHTSFTKTNQTLLHHCLGVKVTSLLLVTEVSALLVPSGAWHWPMVTARTRPRQPGQLTSGQHSQGQGGN